MSMTTKDFEILADEIKHVEDIDLRAEVARTVADACERCNKRFNRDRFMVACSVQKPIDIL